MAVFLKVSYFETDQVATVTVGPLQTRALADVLVSTIDNPELFPRKGYFVTEVQLAGPREIKALKPSAFMRLLLIWFMPAPTIRIGFL